MENKYTYIINECRKVRKEINDKIIDLLKKHNTDVVMCGDLCDTPIVFDGMTDDDVFTLDTIVLRTINETNEYITFECSSSYSNNSVTPMSMDIELLIEVYDWIISNEDDLFDDDDE